MPDFVEVRVIHNGFPGLIGAIRAVNDVNLSNQIHAHANWFIGRMADAVPRPSSVYNRTRYPLPLHQSLHADVKRSFLKLGWTINYGSTAPYARPIVFGSERTNYPITANRSPALIFFWEKMNRWAKFVPPDHVTHPGITKPNNFPLIALSRNAAAFRQQIIDMGFSIIDPIRVHFSRS